MVSEESYSPEGRLAVTRKFTYYPNGAVREILTGEVGSHSIRIEYFDSKTGKNPQNPM